MTDKREVITDRAPRALGACCQAVVANGFVFISGQIAIEPATGTMIESADVRDHATRVMENVHAVLQAAGSSLARVVKATIYLADMADFAAVNEVYSRYLGDGIR